MALTNRDLGAVVAELGVVIVAHKAWLSELDGRIGDGDHGANMAKGFARAADRVAGQDLTLGAALAILSDVLMGEIGGSMGPLYGVMFDDMAQALAGRVGPSFSVTPRRSASSAAASGSPSTCAR